MATRKRTSKRQKAVVRQLTVEEAIKWLGTEAHLTNRRRWQRVIVAVRDRRDPHGFPSITLNEAV